MKKNIFIALFVFALFQAYSQIQDNTGSSNPFNNLSQQEKNTKLLDICNIKYKTSDAKKVKVIIKLLLEAGADPDYILEHNQMPVLYQAIIRNTNNKSALAYAVSNENFELAEYLIKNGDNINKPFLFYWDHYKAYLFHGMFYTVNGYNSHYHIYSDGTIKKALELGADPYLKDEDGNNAFQLAYRR